MSAFRKEHLVSVKQLHLTNMWGYHVCETALINDTSKPNAIAEFYNSKGIDNCTPERFAALDQKKIISETKSREAFLNPFRHWMFDEFWIYENGVERSFGDVKNTQFKFNKGSEIYLLDAPDGEAVVMQSFSNFKQMEVTINNIRDLGSKLTLPPGWKFRSVVLDPDLIVSQKRTNNLAHVFQDDMLNAYRGSDGGKAFSLVP